MTPPSVLRFEFDQLQKRVDALEEDTKPGGVMGNGERDNALRDASPVDLCICGPKTRGEHGCLCAERPYSINGYYEPQETVLEEAGRLVSHDRGNTYSHPFDDFGRVTGMALALWGRGPETQEEHALYMILVKLARLSQTPDHRDSIVDIAGYAKTYDMVLQKRLTLKG